MNERSGNVCMRAPFVASSHLQEEPTPTVSFSPLTIDRENALGHSNLGPDGDKRKKAIDEKHEFVMYIIFAFVTVGIVPEKLDHS
jgi:hypothetical protein